MKYVAEIDHVRELSLRGDADLATWRERLRAENLDPIEKDGAAQGLLIAAEMKFRGVRFREVSFSILARGADGVDGALLVQAWNSVRFFAFVERTFFATPYAHGRVAVSEHAFAVDGALRAERAPREAMRAEPGGWEGPVYLPGGRKKFFAYITGLTETYAVDARDRFDGIAFTPRQWQLRADARHAKSKTYTR